MSRSGFLSALTKRSSKSEPVDASLYYAVLCHEYPGLTLKAILEDMTEAQVYGLFQSLPEIRKANARRAAVSIADEMLERIGPALATRLGLEYKSARRR